jgi:cytochrome c5
MDHIEDRKFLRKFSAVIAGFVILTAALIALALSMKSDTDPNANPSQALLTEERVKPVASVRVGEEGAAALAQVQQASAPAAAAGPADGEQVYNGLCMSCHGAGVAGAPIRGSEQMAQRLDEKGVDTLVSSVINGLNVMPPRGGNPALTDEEIRAAVEFMIQ